MKKQEIKEIELAVELKKNQKKENEIVVKRIAAEG